MMLPQRLHSLSKLVALLLLTAAAIVPASSFAQINLKVVDLVEPTLCGRPNTTNAYGSNMPVEARITNTGATAAMPGQVKMDFNNGQTLSTQAWSGGINMGDTVTISFTNIDLSTIGNYPIKIWTEITGDVDNSDDTLSLTLKSLDNPTITLPWLQGFEAVPNMTLSADECGISGASDMDYSTPDPGVARMRTNAGASYPHSGNRAATFDRVGSGADASSFLTITLDMSDYGVSDSVLMDFWIMDHADEDNANDKVWVRGEDQEPWIEVLDFNHTGTANGVWNFVEGLNLSYWLDDDGQDYSESTQIRFGWQDNGESININGSDGITIDDIEIYIQPVFDLAVVDVLNPPAGSCGGSANEPVTVVLQNVGADVVGTSSTLNIGYSVNGGTAVVETTNPPAILFEDDTMHYTFTTGINFTTAGNYTLKLWPGLVGDEKLSNDTLENYTITASAISSFPYTENFDAFTPDNAAAEPFAEPNPNAFPNDWQNTVGDGADWYARSAATATGNTGPTADHTSGSGNYVFVEDGGNNNSAVSLVRPCMNLSSVSNAHLNYWVSSYNDGGSADNTLLVEVWHGGAWNQVDSIGSLASTAWTQRDVDISAYSGVVKVRWRVNNSNANTEHDIAIDDVSIYAAVGIASDPVNDTICAGETTGFGMTASGSPSSYQWQESTNGGTSWSNVTNGGVYSGATTDSLTLTGAGAGVNGNTYRCLVTDGIGQTDSTNSAVLVVNSSTALDLGNDTTVCASNFTLDATAAFSSFLWNDASTAQTLVVDSTNTYSVTATNSSGCASSDAITVMFIDYLTDTVSESICAGDSLMIGGNYYSTAGLYNDTVITGTGCDSLITTNLSINATSSSTASLSICMGDSALLGGSYQTTAGMYMDTVPGSNSCDSIITTTLSITAPITTNASASICTGDSIMLGGSYQTMAGTYNDTLTGSNSCDSIVATTLTVTSVLTSSVSVSICMGDSILLGGAMQTTAGVYLDTVPTAGCDSVITTTLTVSSMLASNASESICTGDSILLGGAYQTTAGMYVDTLTSSAGCDSVVTTTLTVSSVLTSSASASICAGDSMLLGGAYQTSAGMYLDTLASSAGCDSVITTTLSVNSADMDTVDVAICAGDSVMVGSAWYTTTGLYADSTTNANGCDSIAWTNLTVVTQLASADTVNICLGDSAMIGGVWQSIAGTYVDTLTSGGGCDSIASTLLVVNTGPIPAVTIVGAGPLCEGTPITLLGDVTNGHTYEWSTGDTTSTIVISTSGNYCLTVTDTLGCTGVACTDLQFTAPPSVAIIGADSVCAGDTLTLTASGADSYAWSPNTNISSTTDETVLVWPDVDITYSVTGTIAGCDGDANHSIVVVSSGPPCPTSIQELALVNASAYVQQQQQRIVVELGAGQPGQYTLSLYNLLGTRVAQQRFTHVNAAATQTVNIDQLPAGVYVVEVASGKGVSRQKVVKR